MQYRLVVWTSCRQVAYVGDATGEDQDAGDLFEDDEPNGMTKRELYKQNKEAKQMERLTRRMQGGSCCMHLAVSYAAHSCM